VLDRRIREGPAQLDRGEDVSGPEAQRRSRARLAAQLSDPKAARGDAAG
jgi:hypothetical protein